MENTKEKIIDWEKEFDKKFPNELSAYQHRTGEYVRLFNPAVDANEIKDFVSEALSFQKQEMVARIEKYFYSLLNRIPTPDPITMQEELKRTLNK